MTARSVNRWTAAKVASRGRQRVKYATRDDEEENPEAQQREADVCQENAAAAFWTFPTAEEKGFDLGAKNTKLSLRSTVVAARFAFS